MINILYIKNRNGQCCRLPRPTATRGINATSGALGDAQASSCRLQEGVVRTAQDRPRLPKSIDFASARLFAHVIVLDQPIALGMKRVDVLESRGKIVLGGGLRLLVLLKFRLHVRLGRLLL